MKTYCLVLPEYPDQIESAKQHFESVGLEDVNFFWGINAPVAGLATSHPYEIDNPGSGFKMGAKPTGIWLSHYMVWSAALQTNEDKFLILENDAKFPVDWKSKLEEALKNTPTNFDFLHIGSCCVEGHPKTHVGGDVWKTVHAQCTHAYIVRRGTIPFLLRTLRKIWAPLDCQLIFECFPHLNTYAVLPRIVDQFNTVLPP